MPLLLVACAAAVAVMGGLRWYAAESPVSASLIYDASAFAATPDDVAAALGGPLTDNEQQTIRAWSRVEVEQAFAGLRVRFVDDRRAFWRIRVVSSVVPRTLTGRATLSAAGASYALGPLGGGGFLNFTTLALKAVLYRPPGTSREDLVAAIGRGIGRSAVHEFTHLMLGPDSRHSGDDGTYEYESADRRSQYYGQLRWADARPLLERRLGARR
jgi:hypothetical protein